MALKREVEQGFREVQSRLDSLISEIGPHKAWRLRPDEFLTRMRNLKGEVAALQSRVTDLIYEMEEEIA